MKKSNKENNAPETILEKLKNDSENKIDVPAIEAIKKDYNSEKTEKRGRKKKVNIEEDENKKIFAAGLTLSASIGLNILVKRLPKPIPLTKEEAESFDKAFTQLAQKYYSSVQKFGEELNLSLMLLFILLPRLEFKKNKTEKNENQKSE